MKSLSVFLCLLIAGALMTACEKNNVEEINSASSEKQLEQRVNDQYVDYVAKHGEVTIEYSSLEEVNRLLLEHGLNPITLEEIGVAEEDYKEAQARINGMGSRNTCPINSFYNYLGDLNGSGSATTFDLIKFNQWAAGTYTPDPDRLENFGLISYYHEGTFIPPSNRDKDILAQMILGICNIQ